jgi:hypothetical protein
MQNDPFEKFLEALEDFVDARDDMWQEERYSNVKEMNKIKAERVDPAKQRMRDAFNQAVKASINNYPAVKKEFFMEQ